MWGVAEVLRTHGDEVMAKDMLGGLGGLERVERSCKDLAHRILARGTLPGFNEVELLERIRSTIRGHSNLRKWLERAGYDAITSRTAQLKDQILVFKSNQAKLTDEITYDNNGKPIPMSKRYNSLSPDIRY